MVCACRQSQQKKFTTSVHLFRSALSGVARGASPSARPPVLHPARGPAFMMAAMPQPQVDRENIASTYQLIRPHIRRTPVIEVEGADFGLNGVQLVHKLELLQHSGSFKARGAFANLLMREIPAAGVVAASGGNHGAAVAFAAMKLKRPARIFVPQVASPTKLERIRVVHAYDQVETLLGQGTVGLELESQCPQLDTLLVAVGGGGLIGGIAAWYGSRIKIVGVEPEAAPTLTRARQAGRPVDAEAGGIAADSLAPKRVGEMMFPISQAHVQSVLLVSDDAIVEAQRALWKVLRTVAEPGGAAAFAALLSRRYQAQPKERVGVLVCGGNTAAVDFQR